MPQNTTDLRRWHIPGPVIEIRWLMPVRLKTRQSDWPIACWLPTTSATIRPAYGLSGKARRTRSRRLARPVTFCKK